MLGGGGWREVGTQVGGSSFLGSRSGAVGGVPDCVRVAGEVVVGPQVGGSSILGSRSGAAGGIPVRARD